MILAGQLSTGATVEQMVTVKLQLFVLPEASLAVQTTVFYLPGKSSRWAGCMSP